MITIEQMVQREVLCCMSSLVSTLASGYGDLGDLNKNLRDLGEQAYELVVPVLDYEEAATEAGWVKHVGGFHIPKQPDTEDHNSKSWPELCETQGLDPYEREIFEHWAVSQWLADKLIEQGERVDTDFGGLNIWARTTTGQAISMDGCIQHIYKAMTAPLDSVAPGV